MPLDIGTFRKAFRALADAQKLDWRVKGFYGCNGKIYPFGTDTKVLSTVFEALAAPLIYNIAQAQGLEVSGSPQTVYPDFTLSRPNEKANRIAIDIKTTYRKTPGSSFVYTLGSYTSFLRNGTKNILFPYSEYSEHWVIGFVYTRSPGALAKVYETSDSNQLSCPYEKVEYFIQEKYKIGGLRPASGNTANIGSFPASNVEILEQGIGPFSKHGKEIFDDYWRHFPRGDDWSYASVEEFLAWRDSRKDK